MTQSTSNEINFGEYSLICLLVWETIKSCNNDSASILTNYLKTQSLLYLFIFTHIHRLKCFNFDSIHTLVVGIWELNGKPLRSFKGELWLNIYPPKDDQKLCKRESELIIGSFRTIKTRKQSQIRTRSISVMGEKIN